MIAEQVLILLLSLFAPVVYGVAYVRMAVAEKAEKARLRERNNRGVLVAPAGGSGGSDAVARRVIPADIRAEIDQTPEWWDGEFHALLTKTGEPRIIHEINWVEQRTLTGANVTAAFVDYEYLGCPCGECKRGRFTR